MEQLLLWYASLVPALEVALLLASRAVFGVLVGAVSAVVFAVTEKPFRNAAVICVT